MGEKQCGENQFRRRCTVVARYAGAAVAFLLIARFVLFQFSFRAGTSKKLGNVFCEHNDGFMLCIFELSVSVSQFKRSPFVSRFFLFLQL